MELGLAGKRALVVGSTAGIGFALAKGLAAEGANVVLTGRTQATVDAALKRLKDAVPAAKVTGVAANCASAAGAEAVFAQVPALDVLVNSLGIYGRKAAFDITDAEWQHFFETNVMSGVRFARHYAPGMAQRGWGRVVFVSSESALNIPKEMIHYGMTTHTETTDKLRAERAKSQGITVAEIEAAFFRDFRPTSLIRRFTTADEVAALGVYLCSEAASGTSGAAMRVDGGVVNQIM
jgi:NAD(P)-dependent dehydrogenase (short-subunit alcohol dehydrogenase family)